MQLSEVSGKKNGGFEISAGIWKDCIGNISSSAINAGRTLVQFKVVHRLHLSPTKMKKISQNASDICIKCSLGQGTLSHLFVFCHKIQPFWNSIFSVRL